MRHVLVDDKVQQVVIHGFAFPRGVYPTEPMDPRPGYTEHFEAADDTGAEPTSQSGATPSDQWEQWPDRFVFDAAISATRVRALCRGFFSLLPGRIYPILDVLGSDAFREIDPYLAYDLVGIEKFLDGVREFGPWLFDDGMVGFGAMSLDPFLYIFLDEHKIVTVRMQLDLKEHVEKYLSAFDLRAVDEIRAVDAAEHEHRSILRTRPAREAISVDEIIERLRDSWSLQLNIDATTNVDAEGSDLGITGWQCVVRCSMDGDETDSYAEVLLSADCLDSAEQLTDHAVNEQARSDEGWSDLDVIRADRVTAEQLDEWLDRSGVVAAGVCQVHDIRWLAGGPRKAGRSTRKRPE